MYKSQVIIIIIITEYVIRIYLRVQNYTTKLPIYIIVIITIRKPFLKDMFMFKYTNVQWLPGNHCSGIIIHIHTCKIHKLNSVYSLTINTIHVATR